MLPLSHIFKYFNKRDKMKKKNTIIVMDMSTNIINKLLSQLQLSHKMKIPQKEPV